jgi:hypothetical protein
LPSKRRGKKENIPFWGDISVFFWNS